MRWSLVAKLKKRRFSQKIEGGFQVNGGGKRIEIVTIYVENAHRLFSLLTNLCPPGSSPRPGKRHRLVEIKREGGVLWRGQKLRNNE